MENPLKKISSQIFKKIIIKENKVNKIQIKFKDKTYECFIGEATYEIPENTENLGKIIDCLGKFSFFTGVGQFSESGFGQVIIE
ncbi:MAG: hypothetical protein ACRC0V_00120 [Fusobacteriaceae bacterium]